MTLRAACIHGRYEEHLDPDDDGIPHLYCSDFREVTIDYERIEGILVEFAGDWYDAVIREGQIYDFGRVKDAVAAAIGDTP